MVKEWLKKKLDITIERLNEESHKNFRESRPDLIGTEHDKPGGFCHKRWEAFIKSYKDGDEIWEFDSGGWEQLCGRCGCSIVRNGEIIKSYVTSMN